jgi:hypothetical protein
LAQIECVVENLVSAGLLEFTLRYPATEQGDGDDAGPLARLDVPHCVADEDGVWGLHMGAIEGDLDDVGRGLAVSTSADTR